MIRQLRGLDIRYKAESKIDGLVMMAKGVRTVERKSMHRPGHGIQGDDKINFAVLETADTTFKIL